MSIVWELETISTSDMSRMTSKICNMIFVFVYSNFFADYLILYVKRLGYAAKTAVLQVLFEILMAADRGDLAALVLLDLTAAFDTVDHDILLQRLKASFGINGIGIGIALRWFLVLPGRTITVRTTWRCQVNHRRAHLWSECHRSQSWAPYCSSRTLKI